MGPGQVKTEEELLDAIDRGSFGGGRSGRELDVHLIIDGHS